MPRHFPSSEWAKNEENPRIFLRCHKPNRGAVSERFSGSGESGK